MTEKFTLEYAKTLDQADPLAHYRDEFCLIKDTIYLDGNSLGLLSKRSEQAVEDVMQAWKTRGIDGWTEGEQPWFYLPEKLGELMAPLVGAEPDEVIVTGSTTANLHQLLATFYEPENGKTKIVTDELSFPTDIYALQSQIALKGLDPEEHLIKVKSRDGHTLDEEDIIQAMTEQVAVVVLSGVQYRSGQVLDMEKLTKAAHGRNILIGFDLCHSIGSVPHDLSGWGTDFAFWCTYKHLNGGPGAAGALYVNKRHFGVQPGLSGWFGSDKTRQFDMEHEFVSAGHAGAFQMGTPNLLSMAPLSGSLEIFNEAGLPAVRKKSLELTGYMMDLIGHELAGYGFQVRNPADESRGGHLFIEHPEAARICRALKEERIIPDFRAPNGIRLAPVALYNTFEEVWQTVQKLKKIMDGETYKKFENKRGVVA
ncbi:kynureninase [Bacillus mangrovi]|uniref:Kynureninase n=1 Tax=Metabacillus mangrovi TaxID=1491830 RepID=A0A7X2V4E0_9BACI|nr:kynureninase [Metabacillus mangrovi]MTH53667.1 kynureninase [Metabacillus mangrovi]